MQVQPELAIVQHVCERIGKELALLFLKLFLNESMVHCFMKCHKNQAGGLNIWKDSSSCRCFDCMLKSSIHFSHSFVPRPLSGCESEASCHSFLLPSFFLQRCTFFWSDLNCGQDGGTVSQTESRFKARWNFTVVTNILWQLFIIWFWDFPPPSHHYHHAPRDLLSDLSA